MELRPVLGIGLCVAFPGGLGTADMTRRCQEAGIPIHEVTRRT